MTRPVFEPNQLWWRVLNRLYHLAGVEEFCGDHQLCGVHKGKRAQGTY